MNRALTIFSLIIFFISTAFSQEIDSLESFKQEVEKSLKFQTGTIKLTEGHGTLVVPKGFHFLDKKQSAYVLTDLWGNPTDETIIGMLFPINKRVMDDNSFGFTISYDDMGYVEDDDAGSINYDDLLKSSKEDIAAENEDRKQEGYSTIELVGWAAKPYYDENRKVLHWAKELKFEEDELNTLNYNLRILGREGVYLVNAVASMNELPEVNQNVDNLISSITFDEGYKYSDYTSGDKIASWTVGGLVAGKVLAKTGIIAGILKLWKVIAVAVVAFFSFIWKKLRGKKEEEIEPNTEDTISSNDDELPNIPNKE